VQRAPGMPHTTSMGRKLNAQLGASRRGGVKVVSAVSARADAIILCTERDGWMHRGGLSIRRAFRATRWLAWTVSARQTHALVIAPPTVVAGMYCPAVTLAELGLPNPAGKSGRFERAKKREGRGNAMTRSGAMSTSRFGEC